MALVGTGLLGLGLISRRRKRACFYPLADGIFAARQPRVVTPAAAGRALPQP